MKLLFIMPCNAYGYKAKKDCDCLYCTEHFYIEKNAKTKVYTYKKMNFNNYEQANQVREISKIELEE